MKILLHMCCAPCSCYPVKKLREEGFEPVGYFFNPNIHPYQEKPHYYGRKDIVKFLQSIRLNQIPWKEYTLYG